MQDMCSIYKPWIHPILEYAQIEQHADSLFSHTLIVEMPQLWD